MQERIVRTYDQAIDILRIIAILAVIMIHSSTRTIETTGNDLLRIPWTLFLNQISRFAVPLFFMISGFVLELSYSFNTNYFEYLKKRFSRILIPYVFWSFIYFFFVYKNHSLGFLSSLFGGNASYQLYFIPSLLIFYIIFPFFHKLNKIFANKWVLITLGLLQIFLLSLDYYFHSIHLVFPLAVSLLNFYVFILGMVASHNQGKVKEFVEKRRVLITAITLAFVFYVFFEGKILFYKTSNYLSFYSQWRPSVFLYTLFLGGGLYYVFNKLKINQSIVKTLAGLSFFVFFVHVWVLEFLWKNVGLNLFQLTEGNIARQLWYDPAFFFLTGLFSFTIAFLIHKIPFVSKITG